MSKIVYKKNASAKQDNRIFVIIFNICKPEMVQARAGMVSC